MSKTAVMLWRMLTLSAFVVCVQSCFADYCPLPSCSLVFLFFPPPRLLQQTIIHNTEKSSGWQFAHLLLLGIKFPPSAIFNSEGRKSASAPLENKQLVGDFVCMYWCNAMRLFSAQMLIMFSWLEYDWISQHPLRGKRRELLPGFRGDHNRKLLLACK